MSMKTLPAGLSDIIFDVDGTFVQKDSRIDAAMMRQFYDEVSRVHGISVEAGQKLFETTKTKLEGHTKTLNALLGEGVGSAFIDTAWERAPLEEYIHKDPRLVTLIHKLAGVYRLSILSNGNTTQTLVRKISCLGLTPELFTIILGTSDPGISHQKPDPEIFLLMCERLGIAPKQATYVGDSVATDIVGASGVGMFSVLVGAEDSRASVCIATIYDLEGLLL